MRPIYFIFFFSISVCGCCQEPEWRYVPLTDTLTIPLGDTTISVTQHCYSPHIPTPFFVHLHHNEQTADSALHHYLAQNGGKAISIQNNRQRVISFPLGRQQYLFDPNRIFTSEGIRQSMQLLSRYGPQPAQAVSRLAGSLLQLLPAEQPVIAMHNNTDKAYSLLSYAAGGSYAAETKALFYNPEMDTDDFVLTTDETVFACLKAASINVVPQDNDRMMNDGSLGYYLGKNARTYINIEAEHGHFNEQIKLTEAVMAALNTKPTTSPESSTSLKKP